MGDFPVIFGNNPILIDWYPTPEELELLKDKQPVTIVPFEPWKFAKTDDVLEQADKQVITDPFRRFELLDFSNT